MNEAWRKIKDRPLLLSCLAWFSFLSMYLVVGIISGIKLLPTEKSFVLASPLGISAFAMWPLAIFFAVKKIFEESSVIKKLASILAIFISIIPIALFIFGFTHPMT